MSRILVAEDDPAYQRVLTLVLEREGHEVEAVSDGPQTLARVREKRPDLLLLDVVMPGMDGFTVARLLKADPATATVPIVFITGATDMHHKVQGLATGANDYITKPFRRPELLARVSVALRIGELEHELRRRNADLDELARTDPLTGLANRRALEERLEEELARARRYGHPLSVLMIDIDHFKQVNDAILHAGGDQVLCAFAECLRAHMRTNDMVARIGGEEFAILCPVTLAAGAATLAERIRAAVETLHSRGLSPAAITVSIGVAALGDDRAGAGDQLLLAADARLDIAKRTGRNRVVWQE